MRIAGTTKALEAIATRGFALLPLRLVVGFGFAAHGFAKLERGPERFADILATLGIPAPAPMAWVTTLVELLGGVLLMLGIGVRPLTVPLVGVMTTAMMGVHMRYGFSSIRLQAISESGARFGPIGIELNLLYVAALLALALSKPTPLSLDSWFEKRARRRRINRGNE